MSYRRVQGRFSVNTASEAYQRQLTAPVHKWKKAWVSPTGLQPESSYKICKWVKVPKEEQEQEEEEEDDAEDGFTPAADGDDNDEDMENGEDDEQEDDEEGDGEKPAPKTTGAETPLKEGETAPATAAATPVASGPGDSSTDIAAPISSTQAVSAQLDTSMAPVTSEPAAVGDTPTETGGPLSSTEHTELPSNAIEISNTAPGHTEQGQGDLGGADAGVEVHLPEQSQPSAAETGDVELTEVEGHSGDVVGAPESGAGAEVPPEKDDGLVMGDMEQPKEMDDGVPPPETEQPKTE